MPVDWMDDTQVQAFRDDVISQGALPEETDAFIASKRVPKAMGEIPAATSKTVEAEVSPAPTPQPMMSVMKPETVVPISQPEPILDVQPTPIATPVPIVKKPIEASITQPLPMASEIKPDLPTAPQINFMKPEELPVTQRFGNPNAALYGRNRTGRANINRGTDIKMEAGEPQYAPPEGSWVVKSAYAGNAFNTGWGRSVVIENVDTGETIRRSHLDKVSVEPGQKVTGKILGTTGRTGRTTGYHADVEYTDKNGRLADVTRSPYRNYLKVKGN